MKDYVIDTSQKSAFHLKSFLRRGDCDGRRVPAFLMGELCPEGLQLDETFSIGCGV